MPRKKIVRQFLAIVLALSLTGNLFIPTAQAAELTTPVGETLAFSESEALDIDTKLSPPTQEEQEPEYLDTDIVRISIVLEQRPAIQVFSNEQLDVQEVSAYRDRLRVYQSQLSKRIEDQVLDGNSLDVVWNLTLAANIISANVEYGKLDAIAAMDGVSEVVIEDQFLPTEETDSQVYPYVATSSTMTGTTTAWASGYTGAGTRIAVIDSGLDTDHQSFSGDGLMYALEQEAQKSEDPDNYISDLDLLDAEEIQGVLTQLNIFEALEESGWDADDLYLSEKVPFAFDYLGFDLDVNHEDGMSAGGHGSHVAGIAAANRYILCEDGTYADALTKVHMQGVAPDAQLLVMKVFGSSQSGASVSDYIAAIEDAITLGAQVVNLSIGGGVGFSRTRVYQEVMDGLIECNAVVAVAAGNFGFWGSGSGESGTDQLLHDDDVSYDMVGSPGSYTNALTVASADNCGGVGFYLQVGDDMILYTEPGSEVADLTTIASDDPIPYIFLDGYGTSDDFAALGDAVEGKIVVLSRGGNITFAEKANNAAKAGAIATIIYNNESGVINMDLTDYDYPDIPCVSITQDDAAIFKAAASQPESGSVYEGCVTVSADVGEVLSDGQYTMSEFSSWGVPGSLELKPEITAPGGSIYSVDGVTEGGESYVTNSGTSMASPQVAGMVALLSQYIRQKGLEEKAGLTSRQLITSLLMGTAVPMEDGDGYYSLLQQGAGLANVGSAIQSKLYIMMDEDATSGASDGKVKAEVGDDPDKTGIYTFGFTLYNLSSEEVVYTLRSDLFTQALTTLDGTTYLDTATRALTADAAYEVDGVSYLTGADIDCDLNDDGKTDAEDAQIILDYVVGAHEKPDGKADLNGDGAITTYDAHLLLKGLVTTNILLEPESEAHVNVTLTLTASAKEELDKYPSGAYVEGYIFVEPASSEDGAEEPTSSIPVLGFYGNWSEASMYDRTSYTDALYGEEIESYTGLATNYLLLTYPRDSLYDYWVGNPYRVEDSFPEDKAAINSATTILGYTITLIRNAGGLAYFVSDESGNIKVSDVALQDQACYFYSDGNYSAWQYYDHSAYGILMDVTPASLGFSEGESFTVGVVAVPEYYETAGDLTTEQIKALMSDGTLGAGAYLTNTFVVDDTPPKLEDVKKLENGDLQLKVQDNQYVAVIQILDSAGRKVLTETGVESDKAGQETTIEIDLSGVRINHSCKVLIGDYAGNETVYDVEYSGDEDEIGRMYGFTETSGSPRVIEITPDELYYSSTSKYGGIEVAEQVDFTVTAAEYVGGYVYMAGTDGVLYVAPHGDWASAMPLCSYTDTTKRVYDMAFNYSDSTLYALGSDNTIYTVDLYTGALSKAYTITVTHPKYDNFATYKQLLTLAIDDDGNFYSITNGNGGVYVYLYTWDNDDVEEGSIDDLTAVNIDSSTGYVGYNSYMVERGRMACSKESAYEAMAWDHDNKVLYWTSGVRISGSGVSGSDQGGSTNNILWVFDEEGLASGQAARPNTTEYGDGAAANASELFFETGGLYIVPSDEYSLEKTDVAEYVTLNTDALTLIVKGQFQLSAQAGPWNLSNQAVTWSSSDSSVATVDETGLVTAVSVGTATITATSSATSTVQASCAVTVIEAPELTISALIYGVDEADYSNELVYWADFNSTSPEEWTPIATAAASYYAGTLLEDVLYVYDNQGNMYGVDPDTFDVVGSYGYMGSEWLWTDAAPAPQANTSDGPLYGCIAAICGNGEDFNLIWPELQVGVQVPVGTAYSSVFASDPMVAVAYAGDGGEYTYADAIGGTHLCTDTLLYYVITESGELWSFRLCGFYADGQQYGLVPTDLGATGISLTNASMVSGKAYASLLYDEGSESLLLSSYQGYGINQLYSILPDTCSTTSLGNFGNQVWPVVSLYQYDRIEELTVKIKGTETELFEGETISLTARVYPSAYKNTGVVWSSSDETVATVDQDGVVTGVGDGTATITATSQATEGGTSASASYAVSVKGLTHLDGTTIRAYLTDSDGSMFWADIDGATLALTHQADGAIAYTGAGYHDGKIYASDTKKLYEIDPEDGYTSLAGAAYVSGFEILDATTCPAIQAEVHDYDENWGFVEESKQVDMFGWPVYLSDNNRLVFLQDYTDPDGAMVYELSADGESFGAVTFWKTVTKSSYYYEHFFLLSSDGVLYDGALSCYYTPGYPNDDWGWDGYLTYSIGVELEKLADLELDLGDVNCMSMTLVGDEDTEGLVISCAGDNGVRLYYYDLATGELGKMGVLTGCSDLVGLYVPPVKQSETTVESTAYSISVPGVSNGSVSASPRSAISGTTVTLIITPDEGYELDSLYVTDASGNKLTLTDKGDGRYTFVMPASSVTVSATFKASFHDCPSAKFTDVDITKFYHEALDWAVLNGVTNGTTSTTFSPEDSCTRGQMVTLLYRAAGCPDVSGARNPFTDVKEGTFYYDAVLWAVENGITTGVTSTTFAPDEAVARCQVVTFLYRYAGSPAVSGTNDFTDVDADAWYADAVQWAVENEVTNGMTETTFAPEDDCARAQIVTMLFRYIAG